MGVFIAKLYNCNMGFKIRRLRRKSGGLVTVQTPSHTINLLPEMLYLPREHIQTCCGQMIL